MSIFLKFLSPTFQAGALRVELASSRFVPDVLNKPDRLSIPGGGYK